MTASLRELADANAAQTGYNGKRDPDDYVIEVCQVCGAQLSSGLTPNGRCPVDRAHWSRGGIVIRVVRL